MEIKPFVRNVLTPLDLKGKEPILVECADGGAFVKWNGKEIPAVNFIGSIDSEPFDVRIFQRKLTCPPGKIVQIDAPKKYYLKYNNDNSFLVEEA